MRILYCVQRYGEDIGGGAEGACRMFAERMAANGHVVEVLTSCAREYTTWADHYPAGTTTVNGVRVHRLPVVRERTTTQFGPLSVRVLGHGGSALAVERDWVRTQGPDLEGMEAWLGSNARSFDVAVFMPYLYSTSALGLPVAARHTATVLHPAAHDEPMLALGPFDAEFGAADAIALFTPEEGRSLERRRGPQVPLVEQVGLGVETDPPAASGERFRERFGLGEAPVLLYVGRVEPAKGTDELVRYFQQSKERLGHALKLALVGPLVDQPPEGSDVVMTDFVDSQMRNDAYASSFAFVLPSYLESFSISLCDAWTVRRPALVNANCAVLAGQASRSGAALGYRDYAEFEAALVRLLSDEGLRARMGENGRSYVVRNYGWSQVLRRYEALLSSAILRHRDRTARVHRRFSDAVA